MKRNLFIISAILIVGIILAVFFVLQIKPTTPPAQIPIAPTPLPMAIPTSPPTNNVHPVEVYDLVQQLPYVSPGFNIEYLSISEVFMITVKKNPIDMQKTEAMEWFIQRGIDPKNLNIQYNIYPYLQ